MTTCQVHIVIFNTYGGCLLLHKLVMFENVNDDMDCFCDLIRGPSFPSPVVRFHGVQSVNLKDQSWLWLNQYSLFVSDN